MSKAVSSLFGSRQVLGLVLALMLTVGWAGVAYAETPNDDQYSNPTASGMAAIENSGGTGGEGYVGGTGGGSVSDPSHSSHSSQGSTGGVLGLSVLPDTGGPQLAFVGLCAIALGSAGMLMLRLNRSRR